MRLTIRAKLVAIVAAAGLMLVVLITGTSLIASHLRAELETIQGRYLPRMDLGPRLAAEFERAGRAFQDAVAAHDLDALADVRSRKSAILADINSAGDAIDPVQAGLLREAVEAYFAAASDVSRRLVTGETGEALIGAMADMQRKQALVVERMKSATQLDRNQLRVAFESLARTQSDVGRIRLVLSAACLGVVISLSVWLGRGVLRSLTIVNDGLQRFGRGDFSRRIEGLAGDELGDVAAQANQMADSLRHLSAERDRRDWLTNGQAGLLRELRGDLAPEDVAARAVRFLAMTLEAPVGAIYAAADDGSYLLAAQHALSPSAAGACSRFAPGEGLVGQAALQDELTVVRDPPSDYLRVRSGLGEGPARAIVLMPLRHANRAVGVLELAVFKPWTPEAAELLSLVSETISIALVVARAQAATRDLLSATQKQAERLAVQEEELRSTNEELQAQEEELRQANADLARQTDELETQQRALAERNSELDEARVRLEQRAAELSTVSSYKSQFLANMSHELRTPLNSMLLLSSLLAENEDKMLTTRQVEFARTIHAAGKDLLALINQVLDLAKIESGRQDVEITPVRLDEVAERARRVFAPLARDKGLGFSVTIAPDLPEALATDRRRFEQILTNLLGNAIKFTDRGEVTFRIEGAARDARFERPDLAADDAIAFMVTDTGLGIAPENHERVFTPFEQLDAAADRRYSGTGLGLGIARQLAALLGGELQLRSSLGAGSTFTCYLPRTPPKAAGLATAPAEPQPLLSKTVRAPEAPGAPEDQQFLLLIEDDPVFATTFGEIIQGQGLALVRASSGEEGLRIARERRPRGIVLDVRLPDMDGWRVMEALRADLATSSIPVHFISALDAAERGLAMGAVGYLTKPVTRRDLLRVIESLIPRAAEQSARFLVVEDDTTTADSVLRLLQAEGLEARRASTAGEALTLLDRERYGCMILDLSLPDMNGLDLLRGLRDRVPHSAPKVVVYTARALSRAETMTLEAYAEAIVLKDGSSSERLLDEVRLFVRHFQMRGNGATPVTAPALSHPDLKLKGRTALVVDDDMRTVYALSATLRAKGLEVSVADNGRSALEMLDARPDIDVVLMDIMMPEMDGYEAMRRIRADGRFGALPIIALTAKAMKGDEEKCAAAGASHYLPKPIDADRLFSLIASCLRRREEPPSDA